MFDMFAICGIDDAGYLLAAAAAASSLAGAGLSAAGNREAQDKANQATQAELNRQRGLQQQAEATYSQAKSQAGVGDAQTGIKQGQDQRLAEYQKIQQMPMSFTQPSQTIGKAVVNARDAATMDLSNRARSALAGYDQWLLNRMLQQQQTGNLLGVTASLAKSSGNVLPMELSAAQHAGDGLSGAGGLLSGAGSALGTYGAANGQLCGPSAKPQVQSGTSYSF